MESIKSWTWMKNLFASVYSSWKSIIIFFILLLGGVLLFTTSIDTTHLQSLQRRTSNFFAHFSNQPQLNCPQSITETPKCNSNFTLPPPTANPPPPPSTCPSYFRYIHKDLRPWNSSGITKQAVENAKKDAAFRLVVINNKAYLEKYHNVFQTRDVFTLWGVLQLLIKYPGKVKDFDMMFNCEDMPVVSPANYANVAENDTSNGTDVHNPLPPLFRYSKDDTTVDILFPDWSFWGWPEVNIKPWVTMEKELEKGNKKMKWKNRDPHAYWKGNPWVSETRQDLMHCDLRNGKDWNARLYTQDWGAESRTGFKSSDLSSQCTHRYKIYAEGRSWSVSEKYILACDSPTLFIQTRFRDFFTRGMIPGKHYLPIPSDDKCRAIKDAVDWGNNHPDKAQEIGKTGSGFIQEELKMDYVYDYMLHLLNEYSKLLKYKPTVPKNAVGLCLEFMACKAQGKVKSYMIESMVKSPSNVEPCIMPS